MQLRRAEIDESTIDIAGFNGEIEGNQTTIPAAGANFFVKFQALISRSLWAGAILTALTIVAGALWGILNAVRDGAGAAGAKGVFLVFGVCWTLNFITLVVLTAIGQLQQLEKEERKDSAET